VQQSWTSTYITNFIAFKTNYAATVKTLAELSDPTKTSSAESAGLGQHIQTLVIFDNFLRIIHMAHIAHQGSSITLAKARATVE